MALHHDVTGARPSRGGFLYCRPLLRSFLFLLPCFMFLGVVFIYPLVRVLTWSLTGEDDGQFTFDNFIYAFAKPVYLHVILNTFRISLIITVSTLILAYPVAYLLTRVSTAIQGALLLLILLPFWMSVLVRTYAWTVLLQRSGPVNEFLMLLGITEEPLQLVHNTTGVVLGMTHILLPFMILPLYSVMRGINPSLLRAAETLGAGPARVFQRVFLPLSLPGVWAGCILVFTISIGLFVGPVLLGGPKSTFIAQLIEVQMNVLVDWNFGAALSILLVSMTMILLYAYSRAVSFTKIWTGP